jgi:hypothetical protein
MKQLFFFLLNFCLLFLYDGAKAQFNQLDHDRKQYYFGINGGVNNSRFRYFPAKDFITNDTILQMTTTSGIGAHIGLLFNYKLNKRFDTRILPSIVFGEKNLQFRVHDFAINKDSIAHFNIQNIYIDVPFQFKLKSDRVADFRFYMLGGGKYAYDLASLSKSRKADKLIRLTPNDFALELGFGFEFYFPLFILAPEVKISQGMMNVLSPDKNLIFSRSLDALKSRTITFSLLIEG